MWEWMRGRCQIQSKVVEGSGADEEEAGVGIRADEQEDGDGNDMGSSEDLNLDDVLPADSGSICKRTGRTLPCLPKVQCGLKKGIDPLRIVLYMTKLCVACSIENGGRSAIRRGGNPLLDRNVIGDKFANDIL